ncbi:MAG: NHL repeat-containing protein [Limisphaerales bacterium]
MKTSTVPHHTIRAWIALGLVLAAVPTVRSQSLTISTLAGQGQFGSFDATGTNAQFSGPTGVTADSAGNVYVGDTGNNTIRKITPARVVSTLAGQPGVRGSADGAGSNAQFASPAGLVVDSAGNLYVGDTDNNTIRKITPTGLVSTVAGQPGAIGSADGLSADALFFHPCGIAADAAGNLYVVDQGNNTIRMVTTEGAVSTLAGLALTFGTNDGVGDQARFYRPFGVAVDRAGNVYVADQGNHTIRKITPAGTVSTLAGKAGTSGTADGAGGNARFDGPAGVAVDNAGNVYVADTGNQTIREITPAGVVSTVAGQVRVSGSADGTGSAAQFNAPWAIAVDSAGKICVADLYNERIRLGQLAVRLDIARAGNQVTISWPTSPADFVLETTAALGPGVTWRALTNAITTAGDRFIQTNSLSSAAMFYRLRQP